MDEYIPDRSDSGLSELDQILEAIKAYSAGRNPNELRVGCYLLTGNMIMEYHKSFQAEDISIEYNQYKVAKSYIRNLLKSNPLPKVLMEYYGGSEEESFLFADKVLFLKDYLYSPKGPLRFRATLP